MYVKANYLLLDIELLAVRQSWAALPVRRSMMLGDDFDWLGDHSANQEALEFVGLMDALHPLPDWSHNACC